MSDLILYNPGVLEVVVDHKSLQIFTTQRGYIELSGRSSQTIARRCNRHDLRHCLPGTVRSSISGETVFCRYLCLIPDYLILEWMIKDNYQKALMIGAIGVSNYLYQIAGFQVKITLTKAEVKVETKALVSADQ
jgi:hypothetical protein